MVALGLFLSHSFLLYSDDSYRHYIPPLFLDSFYLQLPSLNLLHLFNDNKQRYDYIHLLQVLSE